MPNDLLDLTPDQIKALDDILAACVPGNRHLLSGYAGSGKTFLMQSVTQEFQKQHKRVVLTAPTHKAVAVLQTKMRQSGIDVPCITTHSLLSLVPRPVGPVKKLVRRSPAQEIIEDVVIIDECSMVSRDLMQHIDNHLKHCFVLFVGDPAQLPPVNEKASLTFSTLSRSHLDTIVRQAAGNPVLQAAHQVRMSQGGDVTWDWMKPVPAKPAGIYIPNGQSDAWMRKAFTSPEFAEDNDRFRVLCWTNKRVAEINRKVRRWIHGGDTPTPFIAGERVLTRQPIMFNKIQMFNTNEEITVYAIERSEFHYGFEGHAHIEPWRCSFQSWKIHLKEPDGREAVVHLPIHEQEIVEIEEQLVREAHLNAARWEEKAEFGNNVARLQCVYALTVHTSQGSTFQNVFVDIGDIRKRERNNPLEMQQLLYVAMTRPTTALMLINTNSYS